MSESSKTKAELIAEYLKIFIWPVTILFLILIFHNEISDLVETLKTRSFKLGLLEVGGVVDQTDQVLADAQSELEMIRNELNELKSSDSKDPRKFDAVVGRLESMLKNLNGDVGVLKTQVQQQLPVETSSSGKVPKELLSREEKQRANELNKVQAAKQWEQKGFEQILQGDFEGASKSFEKAYNIYPEYHNVHEILNLLNKYRSELKAGNLRAKFKIFEEILDKYSWGMPLSIKSRMQQILRTGPIRDKLKERLEKK